MFKICVKIYENNDKKDGFFFEKKSIQMANVYNNFATLYDDMVFFFFYFLVCLNSF
jgi:hypothetical protein